MKNGKVIGKKSKGIFRSIGIGTFSVPVVLIMVLSVIMPTVGAAPAPDLSIDPMDVTVGPEPLVEGVPATVNFLVYNIGEQNAFGFNVSLYDHGAIVADKYLPTMSIGEFINETLDWTPQVPGSYNLTLRAWYGPGSAKQDMDWSNNNVSIPVVVDSRPDVYIYSGDITFTAPDPDYVVDGDDVTIRAVIHNAGTADVAACNVSLWEGRVGGGGELIATLTDITIPGQGQTTVPVVWNTTGFSGRRTMYVSVWGVEPTETELDNNMASITVKVHTHEDRVFDGKDEDITSPFKIQFFITVRSSTTLTITETGNATVFQDFDEQYDIELMEMGKLVIDGGMLNSALNYTIRMMDQTELHLVGAVSNVRIIATGECNVTIEDSMVDAPSIEMNGGFLTITGSRITADRLVLGSTIVNVATSFIDVDETIRVEGRTASFTDTEITISRDYETYELAQDAYPQLEFHDPETRETDGLPSALIAADGAVVNLLNVSAESSVYVIDEDNHFWTAQTLSAEGRTSIININRYLVVKVRDWFGEIVPDAQVTVLDYFDELVIYSGTTDEMGNVQLAVKTDYITSALKPFVGNLRIRASAHGRTSEDVRIAHNKYPQMEFDSNTMNVTIEMPPNPYSGYGRHVLYDYDHEISGLESGLDKNIIIDNGALTLRDTHFSLEQEYPYQWFVLIKGDHGTLKLINATMWSDYPFKLFLEEGGTLNMTAASALYDVRIIAEGASTLQVIDSIVWGGVFTDCNAIEFVGSNLRLSHTRLGASTVSITGGYVHESADLLIKANDVMLANVELTADYEFGEAYEDVKTLSRLVEWFGWGLLNDLDLLTNVSAGYFTYFAAESNITIETQRLTTSGAFIYAVETNILVRRSPLPFQTNLEGTDIGGINLTVISDDMTAVGCSFNRVLDDFGSENGIDDIITLISVDVPGIVCSDGAKVQRYWSLTVRVTDGAGSIRSKALLEVFSTETNERLLPVIGQEDLDSSRTDAAGILTVQILANVTDSTGDYFVGSVYFWLKYDGPQFSENPVYTPTMQVNLKSDLIIDIGFKEVIAPLEKDIIYTLYNAEYSGESLDVKVYNHTFGGYNEDDVLLFLNQTAGLDPERIRFNWTVIRNTTLTMTFYTSAEINGIWEPLREGVIKIYLLETPDPTPNRPAKDWEGNDLNWTVIPDSDGVGNLTIRVPDALGTFQLYIAISGGPFDPTFEPITYRFLDIIVKPPQTIQIISARIQEYPIRVGDPITVQGSVRYIYTDLPVVLAEITVEGSHVSPGRGLTDSEGRFTINMQAPLMPQDNISMEIIARDPSSDEESAIIIEYSVEPPEDEIVEDEFPWGWVMVGIIAAVIAFAIALGAVMMYRRHYGEVVECGECGAFISASSTTCPKCGIEFETDLARCSECEAWIPADSTSCPVCGTAFTIESLEEQVAKEEADEDITPIDQVTTTTAQIAPLALEGASAASKWGDKEDKRRRRIKKRVKKRLTVTDGDDLEAAAGTDEAKDLFVGDEDDMSTRLPGLGVDESMLSDDELSRLLPTEDMLKELMLTSEDVPTGEITEEMEDEEAADEADAESEPEEAPEGEEDVEGAEAAEEEDLSLEEGDMGEELEEIPPPEDEIHEDTILPEEDRPEGDLDTEGPAEEEDLSAEGIDEGRELLSELGLVADVPEETDLDIGEGGDRGSLGMLAEDKTKEAPKLCPNCGGNWILYKDGEYTCRICGEKW